MKLKDRALKALKLYFVLVTFITILLMILGLAFDADRTFSYHAFASPLIYAALGVVPVFIFNPEKELSVKGLIARRIAELTLIEMIFMGIAFSVETIPTERRCVVIGISLGIVVIYVLTFWVEYIFESIESNEMNKYLNSYQNRQRN